MRQLINIRQVLELIELDLLSLIQIRIRFLNIRPRHFRIRSFSERPNGTLCVLLRTLNILVWAHTLSDSCLRFINFLYVHFNRIFNNLINDDWIINVGEFHGRLEQVVNSVRSARQMLVLALDISGDLWRPTHIVQPISFTYTHSRLIQRKELNPPKFS